MELGFQAQAAQPAAAAGERVLRRRGGSDDPDNRTSEMHTHIITQSKLCLSNTLQIRTLEAIGIMNYRINADTKIIKDDRDATKTYAEDAKACKPNADDNIRKIGTPHIRL